jgi:phosphatidylcholine synthase
VLRTLLAWSVHAYTALGAVAALAALLAAAGGDLRVAFLWLAFQVFIDATDGAFARLARVDERARAIDGARLDDIVDYLTYVFVPAAIILLARLVPEALGWPVAIAMLVSSGFGFARTDAKTSDHYFTGFPSYWNIVVLYLVALKVGPVVNTIVLLVLAALVFVPVRYVYPSRTRPLRRVTVALGVLWGLQMIAMMWRMPGVPAWLAWTSLVFPAYYLALSFALELRRRAGSAS